MQVMLFPPIQHVHHTVAAITKEEAALCKEKTLFSLAKAGCFATAARVFAATSFALWACSEVVLALPRCIVIGTSLPVSWKMVDLYNRTFKTSVLQGMSLACAAVLPEVMYQKMQVDRSLFVTHLQMLLDTLPDFPHVSCFMTDNQRDNLFEPAAKMWTALGFSDSLWRDLVQEELWKEYQLQPTLGGEILDLTSMEFRKRYLAALYRHIGKRLNEGGSIERLDLTSFIMAYNILSSEVKDRVFASKPGFAVKLQDPKSEEAILFKNVTGYRFLSAERVRQNRVLFEKMKKAKQELIEENIYSKDDIECMMGLSFAAVTSIGALHFIEADPNHALYPQVGALSKDEKRALFQRLCMDEKVIKNRSPLYNDPKVDQIFQNIVAYKTNVVDHMMQAEDLSPEDTVEWSHVFSDGNENSV